MAVLEVAGRKFFPVSATATGRASTQVGDVDDDRLGPTVAAAGPERSFAHVREADNRQSSETLASDIFECGHDGSDDERLCQEAARRFSGGPSRFSTIFCGRLQ
jgi:hypothetical protein